MSQADQAVEAIGRIFNARSVTIIGASSDPNKFGYMTLDTMMRAGYEGAIYPVNPKGGEILGLKVYRSLAEVPGKPDLAVIIVPVKLVAEVLRQVGEKGIPGAVITTGGFREAGRDDLEEELRSISHQYGLRIIGPNIAGINYLPNKLCAMFFPVITTRGPLAIVCQSGTVSNGLSEWAADEGLGICAAVNLGNQLDLCESDFLDFFAADENAKTIAMYIEGVEEGRHFLEAIKRTTARKPVVILKAGRTAVGQKSAASHTGSLAGSHEVFSAACSQFGAISVNDLETLYDCAKALATMREPAGNRVLIISTSGGANTTAVDEAEAQGLAVPALPKEFVAELKGLELSPLAVLSNPLDLVSLSAEHFRRVVLLANQFDVADILLLNFGDPVVGATELAEELVAKIKASLAVCYFAGGEEEKLGRVKMQKAGIPVFSAPERAMRGIGAAVWVARYRRVREQRPTFEPLIAVERRGPMDEERRFVPEPEAIRYLEDYDIPYPPNGLARSIEEAVEIADRLGYPVVLKIVSSDVPHKSDAGGVAIGLVSADEVAEGFKRILEHVQVAVPGASVEGILVCKQAPEGLEVIVGALEDSVFGPTVMFGLGGVFTEVLRDVTFRIAPLQRVDAEEMIREIRGYPLLTGTRGQPRYDIDRLVDLLVAVSRLVTERSYIKELDLNPVRLFPGGPMALDVRVLETEIHRDL